MNSSKILPTVLAIGAGLCTGTALHANSFSAIPLVTAALTPTTPKLGDAIELAIDLPFYGSEVLPLHFTYSLPASVEVIASDLPVRTNPDGRHIVEWSGVHNKRAQWRVRFRFTQEGYSHFYGHMKIRRDDQVTLNAAAISFVKRMAWSAGWSREQVKQEAQSPRLLANLESFYTIYPANFYVLAKKESLRIEDWDFDTSWKKLRHWWDTRRRSFWI